MRPFQRLNIFDRSSLSSVVRLTGAERELGRSGHCLHAFKAKAVRRQARRRRQRWWAMAIIVLLHSSPKPHGHAPGEPTPKLTNRPRQPPLSRYLARPNQDDRGPEGGWPCRLRAASGANHRRPGRPWALRCNRGLPTDNAHIEALLAFMKPPPPHHLDLPISTRFRTIRSPTSCPTMAQRHVRQHRCSSGMWKMQARAPVPYDE